MTFTKSPYGPIAKPTVTDARQPNSPAQQAAKARFGLVAASWNALSDQQKSSWGTWAAAQRRVEADT